MKHVASTMTVAFALVVSAQCAQITAPQAVSAPPASLVSQTPAHGASMPVVSADGRRVAFVSRAPNLVTNPTSGSYQIFMRDLFTGSLTLVSVTRDRRGGNGHSLLPSLTANGGLVAFESEATDLLADDTNGVSDIFVRELSHGQTWRLGGNGPSRNPIISANGYVAFESHASDLAQADNNNAQDVFLQDVIENPLLVSVNITGTGTPNRGSQLLTITSNGRFVAFWSDATDILEGSNPLGEIYVRDVQNRVTYCVTKGILTYGGPRRFKFALTPDGAFAAFQELNYSGAAPGGRVFQANVFAGTVTNLYCCSRLAPGLAISEDGSQVIFPGNNGLYLSSSPGTEARLLVVDQVGGLPETPLNITSFLVSHDFQQLWFVKNLGNLPAQLFSYHIASNSLVQVSTNTEGGSINASVLVPFSISESGETLAFEAAASDVVPNDLNAAADVFVLGHQLVSSRDTDSPARTGVGHTTLHRTAVNANGTRIAFLSSDNSLTLNDTNRYNDLFVRDFSENTLFAVDGTSNSNSVIEPAFSADGGSVAFERFSGEQRLLGGFTERGFLSRVALRAGQSQILGGPNFAASASHWSPSLSQDGRWLVVRDGDRIRITDLRTPPVPGQASNVIVDVGFDGSFGTVPANGPSSNPSISLDGEWVVFVSQAINLIPRVQVGGAIPGAGGGPYPPGLPQVFAARFWQENTRLVSVNPSGSAWPQGGINPVISANARYVVFETYTGSNIYRHDLLASTQSILLVCSNCSRPQISGDGGLVLYHSDGKVYVRDLGNSVTEMIGLPGASDATISLDGRFVAFVQAGQVQLRDRWNNTTHLLSRNHLGTGGDAPSSRPVFSHDGRTVAFQSFASDLVSGDYNRRRDIFVVRIQPVDTDSDGMDDDWEEHHFGSLAQDGTANGDADQHTDRQEFLAGTDPLDPSSVLRIRTSARRFPPYTLFPELKWTSAPGRTYRLQHTPDLSLLWTDVQDFLTGGFNGVTPTPGAGLYRVKLVD